MRLNCKVIQKVTTPPFQVYPLFLAKYFEAPQVIQFLEGPTPPLFNKGGEGVGGGVPTMNMVTLLLLCQLGYSFIYS